ncbi:hypothetical protein AWC38_SpisGene8835 [Stylophora pistillata]|uniref:DUF5641 domain-containing protein n=1 Tax=Stylophora pistillata TaxID=50429 RepID=A0A2B4SD77_STYPI|nr:hypothetical protein AWC38_SpisGene8835 [Stylophora pistillata]
MLFYGHVLAVFDTKKEAENKVNELVTPQEIEEPVTTLDGPRPRREPKPSKRKLAALENSVENITQKNQESNAFQKQKHMKRKAVVEDKDGTAPVNEKMASQKHKHKNSRKIAGNLNDGDIHVSGQKQLVFKKQKSKRKGEQETNDQEIVTVAKAKRVQNLLLRRQQITVSEDENPDGSETIEAQTVEKTSDLTRGKESVPPCTSLPLHQSPAGHFNSARHQQSSDVMYSLPSPQQSLGGSIGSPQYQPQPGETNFLTPQHRQPSCVTNSLPPVHQSSVANTPQSQQPSGVPSSSPPLQQSLNGNLETPRHHQSSSVINILPPSYQTSGGTNWSIRRALNVTNSFPSPLQSTNKRYITAQEATDTSGTHSSPHQQQHTLTCTVSRSSGSPHFEQATPQLEFSFFKSLHQCSDFDVSDLDQTMNPSYQLEMDDHIHVNRDVVQQGETSFSSLPTACSGCQPLLMSLNKRICSLEAEFEKLKRKKRKNLQPRRKWYDARRDLAPGDVVLMKEDGQNRSDWPMGRVTEAIRSADGKVRKVSLRIVREGRGKVFLRPIKELILLVPVEAQ